MYKELFYACTKTKKQANIARKYSEAAKMDKCFVDICSSKDDPHPDLNAMTECSDTHDTLIIVTDPDFAWTYEEYIDFFRKIMQSQKDPYAVVYMEWDFSSGTSPQLVYPCDDKLAERMIVEEYYLNFMEDPVIRLLGLGIGLFYTKRNEYSQKRVKAHLDNAPYLTESNYDKVLLKAVDDEFTYIPPKDKAFEDLKLCERYMKYKYKGLISGLWYISFPAYDGGVQIIYRSEVSPDDYNFSAYGEVFDFTRHEMSYVIYGDDLSDTFNEDMVRAFECNRIYTVFDLRRENGEPKEKPPADFKDANAHFLSVMKENRDFLTENNTIEMTGLSYEYLAELIEGERKPCKEAALRLGIVLELNNRQLKEFMTSAGYSFPICKRDLAVIGCIERGMTDYEKISEALAELSPSYAIADSPVNPKKDYF